MASLHLRITRDRPLSDRTLGVAELDLPDDGAGLLPFGFSCEDVDRGDAPKVKGATAIPVGIYAVRLYDSPKHGPGTPELVGVPGFQHIQIHSGNGPLDTEGCLLLGLARDDRQVLRSRPACEWLRAEIQRVIKTGGSVSVEIRRAA